MYLKLTDGTTTIDLLDGSPFMLEKGKWSSAVSYRQNDRFGGNPFVSVIERIPLYAASGVDAPTLLAAVDELAGLIDQAWRWKNGEDVDQVFIHYSPTSAVDYLQDILIGPPLGEAGVLLPPTMHDDLYQALINDGITLQFVRRNGEWLGDEDVVVDAAPVEVVNIASVTMTDSLNLHTPLRCEWINDTRDNAATILDDLSGFILVASDSQQITLKDTDSLTFSPAVAPGLWETIAESYAHNGSIRRWRRTSTAAYTATMSLFVPTSSDKRLGIFMSVRNNASESWKITITVYPVGNRSYTMTPIIIDSSVSTPRFIFAGIAYSQLGISRIDFDVDIDNPSIGDSIDFDWVVSIGLDSPTSRVIEVNGMLDNYSDAIHPTLQASAIVVDPASLTESRPFVRAVHSSGYISTPDSRSGDTYLLSSGDIVASLLLLKYENSIYNDWAAISTYSGVIGISKFEMTAKRRPGYLIPT